MVSTALCIILMLLLFALPAYCYGDPTGGTLFQMLGPFLALFWGLWMILANRIRKLVAGLARRARGEEPKRPVP